jgi:signal transduction histidine kinase
VQLEGAQRLVRANPERAEKIIATVRDQVREGLAELRRTVAILRASVDEDLPLSAALTRLASQFEDATGLPIHLNLEACPEDLPAVYRQAFFQAAQEGLTNIQRHAKATEAWLNLNPGGGQISLLISDNGAGIPVPPDAAPGGHFGLAGLKERAALLGGEFYVDPRPGGGTQLTFRLPTTAEIPHE